jgi:LDH2 family malate/lactate/ureidoglycolate dehydrogenase
MIGISMTGMLWAEGSTIGVAPIFGKTPMLSTNPIAVACPTGVGPAFLLDIATSIVPMNRVMLYHETGRTLPAGWAMDANGQPTTDPAMARQLYPLGGSREMGGHKGYGLALLVEILCALLSGGWDPSADADGAYRQQGDAHFFGAIRVDAFRPVADFKAGMDAMLDTLHQVEPVDPQQRVLTPGEPEQMARRARLQDGIPLPPNVVADLTALSETYGVALDLA